MRKRNLSGREMASAVGISRTAFSQILTGRTTPRAPTFSSIVDALRSSDSEREMLTRAYFAVHKQAVARKRERQGTTARVASGSADVFKLEISARLKGWGYQLDSAFGHFDYLLRTKPQICVDLRYGVASWPAILGRELIGRRMVGHAAAESAVVIVVPYIDLGYYALERETHIFAEHKIFVADPNSLPEQLQAIIERDWSRLKKFGVGPEDARLHPVKSAR